MHGGTERRVWCRVHIAIDEKTLELVAVDFTTSDVADVEPVSRAASSEPARDGA